jgi:hypothetical protein
MNGNRLAGEDPDGGGRLSDVREHSDARAPGQRGGDVPDPLPLPGSDSNSFSLIEWGPRIFTASGLLLILLAIYMAGGDALRCARHGDSVDCHLQVSRVLGLVTVERRDILDVVDVAVRLSTQENEDDQTTTSHSVSLMTRDGQEVATLGGEESDTYAEQVDGLLRRRSSAPVSVADSTWIVAGACFGLGFVLFAFGAIAGHVTNVGKRTIYAPSR